MCELRWVTPLLLLAGMVFTVASAEETTEELTLQLWPRERIVKALADVEQQRTDGLISEAMYSRKKEMLEQRIKGTFRPQMLATTDPPLNLLRNAGFEDFNPNTRRNMSRWDWWGGWAWPETAEYDNGQEQRPDYVKSGESSARFKCTGTPARTGISQGIPSITGATGYEFTAWAKGEGDNMLQINFEAGARGTSSGKVGPEWEQIKAVGTPAEGAEKFTLYIYVRGGGTIWLDDARMVPVGVEVEK